jgi:hypothetical protein
LLNRKAYQIEDHRRRLLGDRASSWYRDSVYDYGIGTCVSHDEIKESRKGMDDAITPLFVEQAMPREPAPQQIRNIQPSSALSNSKHVDSLSHP